MRVRGFVLVIAITLGLLTALPPAQAQQTGKVYRIGFLGNHPTTRFKTRIKALLQVLREHGLIEGQHFTTLYRWSQGHHKRYPILATELTQLPVDIIVAQNNQSAFPAKKVTKTIPIVVAIASLPVDLGLVESLAQPGGNVTGVVYPGAAQVTGKMFEFLKEAAPKMSRLALIWDSNHPSHPAYKAALEKSAQSVGVTVQSVIIRGADDVEAALTSIVKGRANGLVVFSTNAIMPERTRIIALADQHRLPSIWIAAKAVREGALMAYTPNRQDMYRRAGGYVAKILRGAKPATLAMDRAAQIDLVINLKTAQKRGLTMPPELLIQASEVIR